jgi:probable HAF family extracellular repeat protein
VLPLIFVSTGSSCKLNVVDYFLQDCLCSNDQDNGGFTFHQLNQTQNKEIAMIRKRSLQILLSILAIANSASVLAYSYNIVDLGNLGGSYIRPVAINNNGQIIGTANNSDFISHAFLYNNGSMIDISAAEGNSISSYGLDFNDNGQVVGYVIKNDSTQPLNGFLYDKGVVTDLGHNVTPAAINNHGQIAVRNSVNRYSSSDNWVILNNGVHTNLGNIQSGVVTDINDNGQATGGFSNPYSGGSAYLYSNGNFLDIGIPTNGPGSIGNAVNNNGEILGNSYTWANNDRSSFYGVRAFTYSNGATTILNSNLGGHDTYGLDINDNGDVVGYASTNTLEWDPVNNPNPEHAFLSRNGIMTDLNSLIDPNAGWLLADAVGINNSGWIIGDGIINGQQRAFLATPVPLPSAGLFMLFGLGFLGSRIQQHKTIRRNK